MYYVYLIRNKRNRWYIGHTNNLKRRYQEHIQGQTFSTSYDPSWKVIYYEAYVNRKLASEREKKLKSFGSAFGHLMRRLKISYKREG